MTIDVKASFLMRGFAATCLWLLGAVKACFLWLLEKFATVGRYMYDPPPRAVKIWFFLALVIIIPALIAGAMLGARWNERWGWGGKNETSSLASVDLKRPDPMPGIRLGTPVVLPLAKGGQHEKAKPQAAPVSQKKVRRKAASTASDSNRSPLGF